VKENTVKRKLARGEVVLGTGVFEFSTTGIARIAAAAGADYVMFDMEHTGWSMETIRMLMSTARATDVVPLVRPPAIRYDAIARPLDLGAMGIVLPMVETEEQARLIVQSAKYPPLGERGAAFGFAHDDYLGGDVLEKMRRANDETLLMALIETVRGVEHVESIAATEGIDVIGIGHFDLTKSMGIPAQFEHPDYLRAVDRIRDAALRHGKAPGITVNDVGTGRRLIAQGFRLIGYSIDAWIFQSALRQGLDGLRASIPSGETSDRR
jgi:2-dehydro-3-deoxyglucarate aldolase/4-hydroxy-2-oxoheptanedioate aldolase